MTTPIIILMLLIWILLGTLSADILVGQIDYPGWAPFKVWKKLDDLERIRKINARRKLYLILGGCISFAIMLLVVIPLGIIELVKYIRWMFSK